MSINHLIDENATPKYDVYLKDLKVEGTLTAETTMDIKGDLTANDVECKDITCENVDATFDITGNNLVANNLTQSAGDRCLLDASAKYTLGDINPVGFVSTPIDLTLSFEEKKVFDLATTLYKRVLTIKGNFKVLAGLAPAPATCGYSMTITDSIFNDFLNASVLYSRGSGQGANGSGADSVYLDVVQTNVLGQVKLGFGNITHTQTPQGFNINNEFEVKLLIV